MAKETTKKKKSSDREEKSGFKKKSASRMTTREKMMARKENLSKKGNGGGLIYPKEGITRIRIKSPGADSELGMEIIHIYLGKDMGSIISPATFDEPCPFMEKYQELKESKDEDDQALAGKMRPGRKYVIGGIGYKDEKGKEIDEDRVDKGFQIARGVYQEIIDLYLDEDEWGDMTDPDEGYDIKISRSGSGKMDTAYSVSPCQRKPLSKKYQGNIDLEEIVRAQIKSYDELETLLAKWLNEDHDEDDDAPKSKKSKDRHQELKKKKKRPKGDI